MAIHASRLKPYNTAAIDSTYAPRAAIVGSDNYGDNYKEIKEALADVVLGMTPNPNQTEEERMEAAKQRLMQYELQDG